MPSCWQAVVAWIRGSEAPDAAAFLPQSSGGTPSYLNTHAFLHLLSLLVFILLVRLVLGPTRQSWGTGGFDDVSAMVGCTPAQAPRYKPHHTIDDHVTLHALYDMITKRLLASPALPCVSATDVCSASRVIVVRVAGTLVRVHNPTITRYGTELRTFVLPALPGSDGAGRAVKATGDVHVEYDGGALELRGLEAACVEYAVGGFGV